MNEKRKEELKEFGKKVRKWALFIGGFAGAVLLTVHGNRYRNDSKRFYNLDLDNSPRNEQEEDCDLGNFTTWEDDSKGELVGIVLGTKLAYLGPVGEHFAKLVNADVNADCAVTIETDK